MRFPLRNYCSRPGEPSDLFACPDVPERSEKIMKFNTDPEWLQRHAELEDNSYVSVGGLVSAVEELERGPVLGLVRVRTIEPAMRV